MIGNENKSNSYRKDLLSFPGGLLKKKFLEMRFHPKKNRSLLLLLSSSSSKGNGNHLPLHTKIAADSIYCMQTVAQQPPEKQGTVTVVMSNEKDTDQIATIYDKENQMMTFSKKHDNETTKQKKDPSSLHKRTRKGELVDITTRNPQAKQHNSHLSLERINHSQSSSKRNIWTSKHNKNDSAFFCWDEKEERDDRSSTRNDLHSSLEEEQREGAQEEEEEEEDTFVYLSHSQKSLQTSTKVRMTASPSFNIENHNRNPINILKEINSLDIFISGMINSKTEHPSPEKEFNNAYYCKLQQEISTPADDIRVLFGGSPHLLKQSSKKKSYVSNNPVSTSWISGSSSDNEFTTNNDSGYDNDDDDEDDSSTKTCSEEEDSSIATTDVNNGLYGIPPNYGFCPLWGNPASRRKAKTRHTRRHELRTKIMNKNVVSPPSRDSIQRQIRDDGEDVIACWTDEVECGSI